ncbi:MAG TPA: diguanylate cyclase [Calditrichia bacterium]|nr:diguanylate cyclase [Calditrichota bacterium]HQU70804.1 diguanylate cyclase [Calditrichia bacterium]HQV30354.1 diguanylate cyclase [Calditrichia bacterium]
MAEQQYGLLYIEDDPASRLLIKKTLAGSVFDFHEAPDGITGLEAARYLCPDLVLLDLRLPDLTGAELATKLRQIPCLRNAILVALTAQKDETTREISLAAGCDGFISKPIDTQNFPTQLQAFLGGHRENIASDRREAAQKQLQEELVDNLSERLIELEHHRGLLESRTKRLKETVQKLEKLLFANNRLQQVSQPAQLKNAILSELADRFGFERCAYLKPDRQGQSLYVHLARGLDHFQLDTLQIPYSEAELKPLFRDRSVTFFSGNTPELPEKSGALLETLGVKSFLLCAFGFASPHFRRLSLSQDLQVPGDQILAEGGLTRSDRQSIEQELGAYFDSEIFRFGGYFFLDISDKNRTLARYDLWMLEMFLADGAFLYQNLLLREQLTRLFINARKDAITDHLTGLFNFRYFSQQLERESSRSSRHKLSMAILMLDLDFFKRYNDTFGHQAGDEVLRILARLLRDNTRHSDFVARYGGEEFVIICPELKRAGGLKLARKLCGIVASTPFPREKELPHRKVTISIGVAAFPEDALTGDDLVEKADRALYLAKAGGRNQARLYEALTPGTA